jgi:pimeloyl-ACP methyl ester carboxylesterase
MTPAFAGSLTTRFIRPTLVLAGLALLLLLVARVYGVRFMLFPTWMLPPAPPRPTLDRGEIWTLGTDQGDVEAFFLPAGSRAPTVIITHGNVELIDDYRTVGDWYRRQGFTVLIPEYRGYGRSEGAPSKNALVADFLAFYDRLKSHPAVDSTQIFFYGRSLGGAVAASAATARPPRALVLESTFASVRQLARERRFPGFLVGDSFDSEVALKDAPFPVMLLHGRHDDIVPVHHVERLAAIIPRSTVLLLNCGHNDCPRSDSEIVRFFHLHAVGTGIPIP